jgi:hypothetical protein
MLRKSLLLGSLYLLAATPAQAEPDANTFLRKIREGDALHLQVLSGYATGYSWSNTWLQQKGAAPLYCKPAKLALTAKHKADILERFIAEHPPMGAQPAGLGLLYALVSTFPCSK